MKFEFDPFQNKNYNPAYHKAFIDYLRYGTPINVPYYLDEVKHLESGYYIWRTRQDHKVRPSHAANHGKIFSYDKRPPTGHPGEEYNCRCWTEPTKPPKDFVTEPKPVEFNPASDANHRGEKRHILYGKFYQDLHDDKIWYSKDIAGDRAHAGAHWKKFRRKGEYLWHINDVDMTGKIMAKKKGVKGNKITWDELIGIR
jgi:SPP1 gp7 family putative phage head morphogenesis protein